MGPGAEGRGSCPGGLGSEGHACRREEKEFGFRGAEGRLLLLRNCRVCIQVSEGGMVSSKAALDGLLPVLSFTTPETTPELLQPAEFYLQVNRFSLLPTEQPRVWVMDW